MDQHPQYGRHQRKSGKIHSPENFKHIAAGLRREKPEKKGQNHKEAYPDHRHDGQERRVNKGTLEERGPREDPRRPTLRTFARFTPLNTPRARIFELHQNSKLWERPAPTRRTGNNLAQFCNFHGASGHSTENCRMLKNNLEDLIQRGYFKNYIKGRMSRRTKQEPKEREIQALIVEKKNQRNRRRSRSS